MSLNKRAVQAERERDKALATIARLTAALADAREALDAAWVLTSDLRIPLWIREALLAALSHPTTEPKRTIRVVSPDGISWVVDEDRTTEPAKAKEQP